jgi:hypothetical protein
MINRMPEASIGITYDSSKDFFIVELIKLPVSLTVKSFRAFRLDIVFLLDTNIDSTLPDTFA